MTEITAIKIGEINNRTYKVLANFVIRAIEIHGFSKADIAFLENNTGNLEQFLINEIAILHNNNVVIDHNELLEMMVIKFKNILSELKEC